MQKHRFNTKGAAEILGLKQGTLEVWRSLGRGPRFLKIGRKVFYDRKDLELFANAFPVETVDSLAIKDTGVKNDN